MNTDTDTSVSENHTGYWILVFSVCTGQVSGSYYILDKDCKLGWVRLSFSYIELGSTYWVRQFDIYWVRQLPNIYWVRQWDIYSTRQLPNIYWVRQNEFYIVPRYLLS